MSMTEYSAGRETRGFYQHRLSSFAFVSSLLHFLSGSDLHTPKNWETILKGISRKTEELEQAAAASC